MIERILMTVSKTCKNLKAFRGFVESFWPVVIVSTKLWQTHWRNDFTEIFVDFKFKLLVRCQYTSNEQPCRYEKRWHQMHVCDLQLHLSLDMQFEQIPSYFQSIGATFKYVYYALVGIWYNRDLWSSLHANELLSFEFQLNIHWIMGSFESLNRFNSKYSCSFWMENIFVWLMDHGSIKLNSLELKCIHLGLP